MLEQFRISDFLEWNAAKTLVINRDFQRGSVWSPAAKIMLIDTILRGYPVPKIYMRSFIDRETKRTKREVVDGQQRLRAIIDFASDRITLSSRAKEFKGKKFSTLSADEQDSFLQYAIAVDQLINANNQLVLEIFARLNSYNIKLNAAELRHAEFQGDFKWSVHEMAVKLFDFWSTNAIFSQSRMIRMENDSFVSECYGIILDGISDGGQPNILKIYRKYDGVDAFDRIECEKRFIQVIEWISEHVAKDLYDTPLMNPPHLLMLFAAVANAKFGIPRGRLEPDEIREAMGVAEINGVRERLLELASVISLEDEPEHFASFWRASQSSTQRIASRRARFPFFERAISGK
jgi:Protein of unknown function DUF262